MARKISFGLNEFYHLYNRGVEKWAIFNDNRDYNRFISLLYIANNRTPVRMETFFQKGLTLQDVFKLDRTESLIDIGSYCLMPNHFHVLVREKINGGISLFMQKLSTGYTMYFNKKNERTGALFQGTFKSKHVNNDAYFDYLFSYIHLNPIKLLNPQWKELDESGIKEMEGFIESFEYSSYLDYLGKNRSQQGILNKEILPEQFSKNFNFKKITNDWLRYKSTISDMQG